MAYTAPTFDRDARDLDRAYTRACHPADGTRPGPADLRAARVQYEAGHHKITARFQQALANEFASNLPATIQERIFTIAWQNNKEDGYDAVEHNYEELAELATTAWELALHQ